MTVVFENIPYKVKDNNPKGDHAIIVCITPCPYFPNKIVAGAYSCEPCRFNGGCNTDATVRCSYIFYKSKVESEYQAYEAENTWWYHFFQAADSNNYDAEYVNSLRIDGVSPEKAAEIIKNS